MEAKLSQKVGKAEVNPFQKGGNKWFIRKK